MQLNINKPYLPHLSFTHSKCLNYYKASSPPRSIGIECPHRSQLWCLNSVLKFENFLDFVNQLLFFSVFHGADIQIFHDYSKMCDVDISFMSILNLISSSNVRDSIYSKCMKLKQKISSRKFQVFEYNVSFLALKLLEIFSYDGMLCRFWVDSNIFLGQINASNSV